MADGQKTALYYWYVVFFFRAAGALLNFVDANNAEDEGVGALVLSIRRFVPPDSVAIDETSLSALQVFNASWQPASGSRRGAWNQSREGLSLFKLLNRCRSVPGTVRYTVSCISI